MLEDLGIDQPGLEFECDGNSHNTRPQ